MKPIRSAKQWPSGSIAAGTEGNPMALPSGTRKPELCLHQGCTKPLPVHRWPRSAFCCGACETADYRRDQEWQQRQTANRSTPDAPVLVPMLLHEHDNLWKLRVRDKVLALAELRRKPKVGSVKRGGD